MAANVPPCVCIPVSAVLHTLSHLDVSLVSWWHDPEKPVDVIDFCVVLDVNGVEQYERYNIPPIPSEAVESTLEGSLPDSIVDHSETSKLATSEKQETIKDRVEHFKVKLTDSATIGDTANVQARVIECTTRIQNIMSMIVESYVKKVDKLQWSVEMVDTCRLIMSDPNNFERLKESELDFYEDAVVGPFFLPNGENECANIQLTFLVLLRRSSSVLLNP